MHRVINHLSSSQKTAVVSTYDLITCSIAFYLSIALRHGNPSPPLFSHPNFNTIFILTVFSQIAVFRLLGLYKGIWRYSSTYDLIKLIKGVTVAVLCSFALVFLFNRLALVPRTSFVIDWLLLIVGLGGGRLTYRVWRDGLITKMRTDQREKVVIIGAGSGGQQLCREIREMSALNMSVVAFIDDDKDKHGRYLHGIKIFGGIDHLAKIIKKFNAKKVLIAIPSASSEQLRYIVNACAHINVEFKILPKITDIISGKVEFSQLRNIKIEDLLGRKQVILDTDSLDSMITGKVILVTGAGGSIGSEICRQIARFSPQKLILFEISEFNLYDLDKNLRKDFPHIDIVSLIGDVRNLIKLENVFSKYRPELVLHAAAYKHVPIMEFNPQEAIHTNVWGTKLLAEIALKYEVERFVMISTDKAINPTSVMGTSKRVAEMICQHLQQFSKQTKFMTVRFGNVLGSSGSVIPLFKEQIQQGGPITVTHPEVRRYFMSIPEASQLVLQAGAIGEGGEIFVLDMGEPILIADLAKHMIRLAGLKESIDIDIKYTGLRPGEKLFEELLSDEEKTLTTKHPLVKIARAREVGLSFDADLNQLLAVYDKLELEGIKEQLQMLVPEYYRPHYLAESTEATSSQLRI